MDFLKALKEIGFTDMVDILIIGFLIYTVLVWFQRTRAAFILTGIVIAAIVYLLARQFDLFLTASVFQSFFTVILIAVIVIFREELRTFFEQVAVRSFNRRFRIRREAVRLLHDEVQTLVKTVADLANDKIGALIVIRGKDMIAGHLDGGIELNGKLSEPLLKSIFDPHSIGHDGALIIERNQISEFGAHLPLSKNLKGMEHTGTRHAAALGLAELTDAVCLVVSEERGTISIARQGKIRHVRDTTDLTNALEEFYDEIHPRQGRRVWRDIYRKNFREKIIALGLAMLLWFVIVYGNEGVYKTYRISVNYPPLPPDVIMQEINPETVTTTFSGPRRAFYFLGSKRIRLFMRDLDVQKKGKQRILITSSDLNFPHQLVLRQLEPDSIEFRIEEKPTEDTANS